MTSAHLGDLRGSKQEGQPVLVPSLCTVPCARPEKRRGHQTSRALGASEDAWLLQEVALESSSLCGFPGISQESKQKLGSPDHLGNHDRLGGDKRLCGGALESGSLSSGFSGKLSRAKV